MLAVNESWRLAPWADVLYACDPGWWVYRRGVPEYLGLKVTADLGAAETFGLQHVALAEREHQILTTPGRIGCGGNSGFQALNLALQFGAPRIVLVGLDYSASAGVHWHGRHRGHLSNPTAARLAEWARRLDAQAVALAELGVEVLNASPASALTAFRKISLEEAL
ncbi:hypothetical protein LRS10_13790 [Phenylobacterium sp. J426]|uniref:hypothetical protein n=1 Tax=Phenylobacterium sp. J426 TaxID=2898439 RepID=UPI002150E62C|nr:hypothetical protein [Phenylobacterium sp. J426]MCR5875165.1 hypothetical protein [Phenylobacterium sp. J426]